MKFLVDAQLPSSLATLLRAAGHDAVHVSTLPSGNRTPDSEIARRADSDQRVVVTKDRDFRDSHLLSGTPRSLLIVTTGNIQNRDLLAMFERHIDVIAEYRQIPHSSNFREIALSLTPRTTPSSNQCATYAT